MCHLFWVIVIVHGSLINYCLSLSLVDVGHFNRTMLNFMFWFYNFSTVFFSEVLFRKFHRRLFDICPECLTCGCCIFIKLVSMLEKCCPSSSDSLQVISDSQQLMVVDRSLMTGLGVGSVNLQKEGKGQIRRNVGVGVLLIFFLIF